jgi:hypothetical protein
VLAVHGDFGVAQHQLGALLGQPLPSGRHLEQLFPMLAFHAAGQGPAFLRVLAVF